MKRFENEVAVVTGGGRGIGFNIAKRLIDEGARVVIADLDVDRARAAAGDLGERCMAQQCDVSDQISVAHLFARLEAEFGELHYLVNCAGAYVPLVPSLSITAEEYDLVMDSNLKGSFLCCQAAVRLMVGRGTKGAIVNFSSLAGRQTSPALGSHYTAAKAGVLGLTRHFAKEFGSFGIRVNVVAPGTTEGERVAGLLNEAGRKAQLANIPLGRFATADDIAPVVLFILSNEAGYVSGATIDINGAVLTI